MSTMKENTGLVERREQIAQVLYECEKRRADYADRLMGLLKPTMEPWEECKDTFLSDADAVLAALTVQGSGLVEVPEGWVLVPKTALDWLNGEGPDENGHWFGDDPEPVFRSKFWWRSKFRAMIEAAPPAQPQDPWRDIFTAACHVLEAGAPGIKEPMRLALAQKIAMRATHASAPKEDVK